MFFTVMFNENRFEDEVQFPVIINDFEELASYTEHLGNLYNCEVLVDPVGKTIYVGPMMWL